jgi:peroxiredoxin (alkyl hydroperoxide reductase subunit C)
MSDEPQVGCARPTGGPVGGPPPEDVDDTQPVQKEPSPMIHVGKPAPDFEAPSYQQGRFGSEKLSDYLGNWVVLCFYPGDFTFV